MRKKSHIYLIGLLLGLSLIFTAAVQPASAASKKYYYPSQVTGYNYTNGEYVKTGTVNLRYDKGRVSLVKDSKSGPLGRSYYTFWKNGNVRRIETTGENDEEHTITYFNKKGRITKTGAGSWYNWPLEYNRKGFISKYVYGKTRKSAKKNSEDYRIEYKFRDNGKLKYAAVMRKYTGGADIPLEIYINKNGLISETIADEKYETQQYNQHCFFTYKKDSKGRVRTIIVKGENSENEKAIMGKYVIKYKSSSKKVFKTTTRSVINTLAMQSPNCDSDFPRYAEELAPALCNNSILPPALSGLMNKSVYVYYYEEDEDDCDC